MPLVCRPDLLVTEESLELDAPFRGLFQFAPVAYHEIDATGSVRRVNQTEYRLLGYRAQVDLPTGLALTADGLLTRRPSHAS